MSVRTAITALTWSLLLTQGCGPNPLVGEVEALRDEMCACDDLDCADSVKKKVNEFDKANKGKKIAVQDNDAMQKLFGEISDCIVTLSLKERASAATGASAPKQNDTASPTAVKEDATPKGAPAPAVPAANSGALADALLSLRSQVCACTDTACTDKYTTAIAALFAQVDALKTEEEKSMMRTSRDGIKKCVEKLKTPAEAPEEEKE